ncbi:MAG: glycosyltransferase family 4 protein [bacterium]
MKICIITSLYKPYSKGGAEQVVENIVNGLMGQGNDISVVTTIPLRKKFSVAGKEKELVICFYPWNLFWFGDIDKKPVWLRLPWHVIDVFSFYSYFKIRRILKEEKPDAVMTHNLKGIGYTAPLAIRRSGIKHIHTLHDVQLVEPSGLIFSPSAEARLIAPLLRAGQIIYTWFNKKLFGSPCIVISPSQWLLDFYVEKGFFKNSKKIVMKNPIQRFPPLKQEDKEAGGNNKNFSLNLLYIGQIEAHKGILFLINAVKKIGNVHLDIVGTGTKLEEMQELAKGSDNIKIHGYIENNLVNKFFAQSDFLIVPSLCYENAPTVIYESFANGAPVIASDIGGIPELVKEDYVGYIFEAGNALDLIRAINKCISEKERWKILKHNALNSVIGQGVKDYVEKLTEEIGNMK